MLFLETTLDFFFFNFKYARMTDILAFNKDLLNVHLNKKIIKEMRILILWYVPPASTLFIYKIKSIE